MGAFLLRTLGGASVLIASATLVLWVRTYFATDGVTWPERVPLHRSVAAEPGRIVVRQYFALL